MTVTEVFYREEPVYHEEHEKHEGDKKGKDIETKQLSK